jgi:ferredoxin
MPTLTIDGRSIDVEEGTMILDAAARVGIRIPALCFQEGCAPQTSCMVCVVRVNEGRRLLPSCATVCSEGMVVESETPEVQAARRTALELLLGDHLGDCLGPCHTICPARMDIPRMVRQIAAGDMTGAVDTVKERIPFPAVLGRVCPELCEKGCRRGQLDSPVAIRLLKRYVGDWDIVQGSAHNPVCKPSSGKRVAIIGAGPAGLTAAYYLAREGHSSTIFDSQPHPGGMLRYGVSEDALPRDVLDAEVASILRLGVELHARVTVGADPSVKDLRRDFDAVLVAAGTLNAQAADALSLPYSDKGIRADRDTQMTPLAGVFVAGGSQTPLRHAVRAVGSGFGAAYAISQYLDGHHVTGSPRPFTVQMGVLDEAALASFAADAPPTGRLTPEGGEVAGFGADEARAEADRCLKCDCSGLEKCRLRDWAIACGASPTRFRDRRRTFCREQTHPAIIYEPGKCITCGLCVQIAEREAETLGLSFVGRGFTVRMAVPFDEPLAAGLERVARECAQACPTGALTLRDSAR